MKPFIHEGRALKMIYDDVEVYHQPIAREGIGEKFRKLVHRIYWGIVLLKERGK